MERDRFDFAVNDMKCIPGGIKEACLIAREYLQHASREDNYSVSTSSCSAVTVTEFIKAVDVLMAYGWENRKNDMVPERHYCDNDCSNLDRCIFCAGEFQLADKDEKGRSLSKKLCPYYRDSGDI